MKPDAVRAGSGKMSGVEWTRAETGTYEDHVVAHVLGATALGYFVADEAAHFVLDIGFVWTILLDGRMSLALERLALAALDVAEDERAALSGEVDALYEANTAAPLTRVTVAPEGCLIEEVECYTGATGRRLLIVCERARISVETVLATGAVMVNAEPAL